MTRKKRTRKIIRGSAPKPRAKAPKAPVAPQVYFSTREEYLTELAKELIDLFEIKPKSDWRVSCGFPKGSRGGRNAISQCWNTSASAGGVYEMFISPELSEAEEVCHVLAHEVIHAHVGVENGHKSPFARVAKRIGLEGPMTATTAGEAFKAATAPVLRRMGDYPHQKLSVNKRKKQGTRLIKAECPCCGLTFRITAKWILATGGRLQCPDPGCSENMIISM